MSLNLDTIRNIRGRSGKKFKRILRRSDMKVLCQSSFYAIQNGVIVDSNYVQSVNFSVFEVGADNEEENGNSMTAFVLKNASGYKVRIRFKYRTYADYGEHDVIVNGTEIGPDEYQYDWKEHTMYIDGTTCTVQVYARNDSSNDAWGAAAGFQLLDVYLEM